MASSTGSGRGSITLRAAAWLFATLAIWAALLRMPLYGVCTLLLAAGLGRPISTAVVAYSRHPRHGRQFLAGLLGLLIVLAALSSGRQAVRKYRAATALPAPPPGARNVVLIVWDTVRAYNLSLYGYHRDTTPNLVEWARKGVRYAVALAPAPWTYPSHSCFFTGQWPYQLNSQWNYALDAPDPTLAEYLASRGYQTAGFAANTQVLQLRDRAGSRLRPLRGLPADASIPPGPHGSRKLDPQEHPQSRRLLRPQVDRPPIPRCARDQRRLPRLAAADGGGIAPSSPS